MTDTATLKLVPSPILDDAQRLASERGWFVFPVRFTAKKGGGFEKRSHKSAEHSGGAKWGMTKDLEQIKQDFTKWPNAGIGVPTGAVNKIIVVEADTTKGHKVDGLAGIKQLEAKHGPLPDTLTAGSPTKSVHRYYQAVPGIQMSNSQSKLAPGVDVRGDGGMMAAPPSVRDDGVYRWLNDTAITTPPVWLIVLLADRDQDDPERAAFALLGRAWPQTGGGCHKAALVVGGFLARLGRTPDQVSDAVAEMTAAIADRTRELCRAARDAAEASADGKPACGLPKLAESFGPEVAALVADWLGYDAAKHYDPGEDGPRPMGYMRGVQFALLVRNNVVYANSTQLTQPAFLLGLAPAKFWRAQFPPAKEGQDFGAYAAPKALIAACVAAGAYNPTRIRGQGVWREGGRIILNFGGPVPDDTEHIYLCFEPIKVREVSSFETERLYQTLQIWPWQQPSFAILYLGWLAYAPVCGAVDWRPHLLLTGPAGSGKTALHGVTKRLLHTTALAITGISSAAGIRQSLGPDSRPVLIDDADKNKEIEQIVHLMRMASSSTDPTLRGTPEGQAQRFMPTATFHIGSVHRMKMLQQDVERIVVLELVKHASDRDEGERLKSELRHFDDRGSDWFGYCVGNVGLLQPSIDAFVLALQITNQRHRWTLATLLGAAFMALHRRLPTEQEAADWAKLHAAATTSHVTSADDRDDAMEALNHLLYHRPIGEQRALGHHIAMGGLVAINPLLTEPINETDSERDKWLKREYRRSCTVLYNHFIMIKAKDRQFEVYLKNQAPAINRIFERTDWEGDWKTTIARVPGVTLTPNAVRFAGHNETARGVIVPGSLIPDPELGEVSDDEVGDRPDF